MHVEDPSPPNPAQTVAQAKAGGQEAAGTGRAAREDRNQHPRYRYSSRLQSTRQIK